MNWNSLQNSCMRYQEIGRTHNMHRYLDMLIANVLLGTSTVENNDEFQNMQL